MDIIHLPLRFRNINRHNLETFGNIRKLFQKPFRKTISKTIQIWKKDDKGDKKVTKMWEAMKGGTGTKPSDAVHLHCSTVAPGVSEVGFAGFGHKLRVAQSDSEWLRDLKTQLLWLPELCTSQLKYGEIQNSTAWMVWRVKQEFYDDTTPSASEKWSDFYFSMTSLKGGEDGRPARCYQVQSGEMRDGNR